MKIKVFIYIIEQTNKLSIIEQHLSF